MTETGCLIDGAHGQYAYPMLVRLAEDNGMSLTTYFQWVTEMAEAGEVMDEREADEFVWLLDEAEAYLQRQAPEGYSYGWVDGEFMFLTNEAWENL